jgi:hypothetical protein
MLVACTHSGPGTASDVLRLKFGILVLEQVVNVALSKQRFQMELGLAVDRLAMDYVYPIQKFPKFSGFFPIFARIFPTFV